MARELDVIADLKGSELLMKSKDVTIAFDATTQEGAHVNAVHVTSESECDVISVEELAGGTADDYYEQITTAVDNLADTYADFHEDHFPDCRSQMIRNITNTMTDRATVNQATVRKVNESWNKSLNQLNCHLHPLDTIASQCRSTLKGLEVSKGEIFGKDCLIGNMPRVPEKAGPKND